MIIEKKNKKKRKKNEKIKEKRNYRTVPDPKILYG